MSQDIIIVAGLFTVLAGIWGVNMVSRKNRMAYIQTMLKEEWGSGHPKEYTYEEFEWISHYYKNRQERRCAKGAFIDDITWNDLEMDDVFLKLNHTYSNIGEDYLYDLLRRPQTEESVLRERERLITYFAEHEKERKQHTALSGNWRNFCRHCFGNFQHHCRSDCVTCGDGCKYQQLL